MKNANIYFWVLVLSMIASCSGGIDIVKMKENGTRAYQAGDYDSSLTIWKKIIHYNLKRNNDVGGDIYTEAGKSALALGQTDEAIHYMEKAEKTGYESPDLYAAQASVYKKIDNLSKEIMALEDYYQKFPEASGINEIKIRLFETYVESENWPLAIDIWPELQTLSEERPELREGYLIVNRELGNGKVCDEIAEKLIYADPDNTIALEYLAKKYYWKAENLYKSEHDKYYKNRTRKQYAKLVKALKRVTADFKVSLKHFEKLYKKNPLPEYAKYIGNIYGRFDDEEKARYYHNKAKQ